MNKSEIKAFLTQQAAEDVNERLLEYMATHIGSVPFATVEKIAYDCQTSPEEIHQFIRSLGFETLIDFKSHLRKANYFEKKDGKLQNVDIQNIASAMMRCEMQNLTEFFNDFDYDKLDRLAEDITAASEVVLLGSRTYTIYAVYMFNRMGIRTTHLDMRDCNILDFIATLDRSALVIPFGFARYHKQHVVSCSLLKKNGYHIVAVTDSERSPMAMLADYSFILPVHSFDFSDSFTAGMLLINMIAYRVGLLDRDSMMQNINNYERLSSEMDVLF